MKQQKIGDRHTAEDGTQLIAVDTDCGCNGDPVCFYKSINCGYKLCDSAGETVCLKNCVKFIPEPDPQPKAESKSHQITQLSELCKLALERKSVSISYRTGSDYGVLPAAFVQNMQGSRIQSMFNRGMYVYTPQKKSRFFNNGE